MDNLLTIGNKPISSEEYLENRNAGFMLPVCKGSRADNKIALTVTYSSGLFSCKAQAKEIFIGGKISTTPTTAITLRPNTQNYVYLERRPGSDEIVMGVGNSRFISESRVCIGLVITGLNTVTSNISYSVDGTSLPTPPNDSTAVLRTDGSQVYWWPIDTPPPELTNRASSIDARLRAIGR